MGLKMFTELVVGGGGVFKGTGGDALPAVLLRTPSEGGFPGGIPPRVADTARDTGMKLQGIGTSGMMVGCKGGCAFSRSLEGF